MHVRTRAPMGWYLVMGVAAALLGLVNPPSATSVTAAAANAAAANAAVVPGAVEAAAPVPAAVNGPAPGSWGDGRLDMFYRDAAGHLARRQYVPAALATWSGAEQLGGGLTSQPAVASWATGRYDVVARGTDNAVWLKSYSGAWSGWGRVGGYATSAPALASTGSGRLSVFIRGTDNALWMKQFVQGSGWSGWARVGGVLTAGPAVVATGSRLDVFVRGTNRGIWHRSFTGSWSPWESLGGGVLGEPAAVATGNGVLNVFVRAADNALYTKRYQPGTGWSAWQPLGGRLMSSPGATMPQTGEAAVFSQAVDGRYYYKRRSATGTWSAWTAVDPALAFRRLGAWVDTLDYSALTPSTAIADMRARGVRTLYLSTARYNSASDILYPTQVDAWLAAAHAAGIRVVGWYVPDYADMTRDTRRTLAIASYVSPAGQRFDEVGIDIEYPLTVPDAAAWNQAVAQHLTAVRAGTILPIAAITLPPVLMDGWPDTTRWATFPWGTIGRLADSILPESYWTSFTPRTRCAAGDPLYCVNTYTRENVVRSRARTGLPVHAIGGVGDTATTAQVSDFVRAARETGAIGGSLYDYRTTSPAFWPYLQQFATL